MNLKQILEQPRLTPVGVARIATTARPDGAQTLAPDTVQEPEPARVRFILTPEEAARRAAAMRGSSELQTAIDALQEMLIAAQTEISQLRAENNALIAAQPRRSPSGRFSKRHR
jgi:hypothetical protein